MTMNTSKYVNVVLTVDEDESVVTVYVTPTAGYEVVHATKNDNGGIKIHVAHTTEPIVGRSYMLDGKHVLVGKIDRDEQGKAVAVYDEHTGEKHLWPAKPTSRI